MGGERVSLRAVQPCTAEVRRPAERAVRRRPSADHLPGFEHGDLDAGRGQPLRGAESGEPGADHQRAGVAGAGDGIGGAQAAGPRSVHRARTVDRGVLAGEPQAGQHLAAEQLAVGRRAAGAEERVRPTDVEVGHPARGDRPPRGVRVGAPEHHGDVDAVRRCRPERAPPTLEVPRLVPVGEQVHVVEAERRGQREARIAQLGADAATVPRLDHVQAGQPRGDGLPAVEVVGGQERHRADERIERTAVAVEGDERARHAGRGGHRPQLGERDPFVPHVGVVELRPRRRVPVGQDQLDRGAFGERREVDDLHHVRQCARRTG